MPIRRSYVDYKREKANYEGSVTSDPETSGSGPHVPLLQPAVRPLISIRRALLPATVAGSHISRLKVKVLILIDTELSSFFSRKGQPPRAS